MAAVSCRVPFFSLFVCFKNNEEWDEFASYWYPFGHTARGSGRERATLLLRLLFTTIIILLSASSSLLLILHSRAHIFSSRPLFVCATAEVSSFIEVQYKVCVRCSFHLFKRERECARIRCKGIFRMGMNEHIAQNICWYVASNFEITFSFPQKLMK